jgi:hypothetical protein
MPTPSFRLLLQSIRLDDPITSCSEAEKIISACIVDWDDLIERARIHGIRPQLERLLNSVSSPGVPDFVKEKLSNANRDNLLRQIRGLAEFFQIKQFFDSHDIILIPFKGFWLADYYYGNIAHRESYDVDLFIDIQHLEKIKAIMHVKGYINTSLITRLTDEYVKRELCEYNFEKYDGETRIQHFEFHWSSSRRLFRMNISIDDLHSQIVRGKIQGKDILVFSPAANLLLTVMHHGGKEQYAYLKQVNDITHIIRKGKDIDWQWLLAEAKKYHLETVLFIGIRQANMLTGQNIPRAVREQVMTRRITRLARGRIRMCAYPVSDPESFGYIIRGWLFHIRSRDGLWIKLQLIWHTFRKELMPWLVPVGLHHFFFNRKIRKKDVKR